MSDSPTSTRYIKDVQFLKDKLLIVKKSFKLLKPFVLCLTCFFARLHINIIIKKDWQCKAGRGRLTPYQSEDPSPTLPTYRGKEEKGKIVEDKKKKEQLGQQKCISPAL